MTHSEQHLLQPTPSAYTYPLLIKQLLLNSMSLHGDQEITYRGDMRYTYRDFNRRIAQLANTLTALDVRAGTTVAVMDWDSHRYLESYFGIPMMGATMFTVNVRLSPAQILYTLADADTEVLLVHTDFLPVIEQIRDQLPLLRHIVVLSDDGKLPEHKLALAGEYEALMAQAGTQYEFPELDENTKAVTFYTTGTTGDPKGVCYSHRHIVLHAMATALSVCSPGGSQRLSTADVYMPITPMFHVLGWGFPYITIMLGLRTVLPGRYLPEVLLKLRETEKVTFSHCVPTILQMLVSGAEKTGQDLSGWKVIIGGSALPPGLCEAALAKGMDVFAGYGMSETGPVVSLALTPARGAPATHADDLKLRCSTGRPSLMVDFRVVDEEMRDVPRDGVSRGEIVLRSPSLTPLYFKKPEASEELWRGGYLHTQDIAVMYPDGVVQIVDRLKDVIKTGGEWVSSIEVEGLITQVPGVQEAAVIGVPDAKWGERPMAFVVAAGDVDAKAVREHLLSHVQAKRLSAYAVPELERILFVGEIPKTSVGKVNKKQLRVDAPQAA
ncbi:fatty acid--CoA ligase [Diaphorobacter ruginosibacter]|uniref:Fatty acid--CoA ligase n=1 Tax=Diaphorobacter ruginosibacter TaxID=1715720 RepID=A0A7G9RJA2_9BURK|nr:fatty acid--CoA ligase [Diaphorobacter ruginosibacter]QNN55677.1 fatty acid--CoA ligase [Diaphorobacter ruginosibacter]